jgi:WD40 repeat protein
MMPGVNRRMSAVLAAVVLMAGAIQSLPAAGPPPEPKPAFQVEAWFPGIAFAPNGKILACSLVLLDAAGGKQLGAGVLDEKLPPCTCVAFSPDGQRLASVHFERQLTSPSHALCLWNVTADNQVRKVATLLHAKDQPHLYEESLHYLVFSPESRMLAARLPGDRTIVWETASGKERRRLYTPGLAVAFAPDRRALTLVSRTGLVQRWDMVANKCANAADGAPREDFIFVCNAAASADGKTIALTDHHSVVLKEARTGKALRRFDDVAGNCLALSAEGGTLAVAEESVLLLDAGTGKESGWLDKQKEAVRALAFSPDGKSLAVGRETSVELWEVAALARAKKASPSHTSVSPLEAKVISQKKTYTLALGGKTAEDFARQFNVEKPLPASPEVDLVLSLRNTSDEVVTLDPRGQFDAYLVGAGALNHPEEEYQTGLTRAGDGALSSEPKKITLAPGESHSVPITSLDFGHCQQSYWLLPGEYTLHVSYHTRVKPAPEGWYKGDDGTGYGTLRAAPLRVKVVAETK